MTSIVEVPKPKEKGPRPGLSFGLYLPAGVLTNGEIGSWNLRTKNRNLLTADSIEEKTGVKRRFVANEAETPAFMGMMAAEEALGGNYDVDAVIVSSSYPTGANLADQLRLEMKLKGVENVLEVGAACSGFSYGLSYLKANEYRFNEARILFVATEKYSPTLVDLRNGGILEDPSMAQTLFSDGAVAMVFRYGRDMKIKAYHNHRFPKEVSQYIRMPIDPTLIRHPYLEQSVPPSQNDKFFQNGPRVYAAVKSAVPELIRQTVKDANLTAKDIALVVPHQGSKPIVGALQEELPEYTVYADYEDGNFSSASIPKALMQARNQGKIKKGDKFVAAGFGAGLLFSGVEVEFPLAA